MNSNAFAYNASAYVIRSASSFFQSPVDYAFFVTNAGDFCIKDKESICWHFVLSASCMI